MAKAEDRKQTAALTEVRIQKRDRFADRETQNPKIRRQERVFSMKTWLFNSKLIFSGLHNPQPTTQNPEPRTRDVSASST
jgi:hypothetical protein